MSDSELITDDLITEAKDIEKQDVLVDELEDKLVDLQSFLQNLTNAGVVCKNDAIALESIEQGILTKKLPVSSFTTGYSKTNFDLAVKQTQVSIESVAIAVGAAIAAAIVMVVAWIIKLLTKSNADSKDDIKDSDARKKRKEEFDRLWKKSQEDMKRASESLKTDNEFQRSSRILDEALERIRSGGGQSKVHQTAGNYTIEGAFEIIEEDNQVKLNSFLQQHYSDLIKQPSTFRDVTNALNGTLDSITSPAGIEEMILALKDINNGKQLSTDDNLKLIDSVCSVMSRIATAGAGDRLDIIHEGVSNYASKITGLMEHKNNHTAHSEQSLRSYIEDNNGRMKSFNPERMDRQVKMLTEFQDTVEKLKTRLSNANDQSETHAVYRDILKTVNQGCRIYIKIITLAIRVRNHIKTFENGLAALMVKEEHNAANVVKIVRENVPKEDQPKSLDELTEQLKSGQFSF